MVVKGGFGGRMCHMCLTNFTHGCLFSVLFREVKKKIIKFMRTTIIQAGARKVVRIIHIYKRTSTRRI